MITKSGVSIRCFRLGRVSFVVDANIAYTPSLRRDMQALVGSVLSSVVADKDNAIGSSKGKLGDMPQVGPRFKALGIARIRVRDTVQLGDDEPAGHTSQEGDVPY